MTKQKIVTEYKAIAVKGGEAWIKNIRYRKRRPTRWSRMERDPDDVVRKHHYVDFIKGSQTGDCAECQQMPCPHTAKLMGWK